MDYVFGNIGVIGLTVAFLLDLLSSFRPGHPGPAEKIASVFSVIGVIAIMIFLGADWPPALLSIVVILGGWVALGMRFYLNLKPVDILATSCLLTLVIAHLLFAVDYVEHPRHKWLLGFHLASVVLGLIVSLATTLTASFFLWQQRVLKNKELEQLTSRIPSLDILYRVLSSFLILSLVLLSLAIASGLVFLDDGFHVDNFKLFGAIFIWGWYLMTLLLKRFLLLPPRIIAQLSVLGCIMLVVMLFAITLLSSGDSRWF